MRVDLMLLKKIHVNILKGTTGRPDSMAKRLGISKRCLYDNMTYLKTAFDAPIAYSRSRKTFYYKVVWEFYVGNITPLKAELLKEILEAIEKF